MRYLGEDELTQVMGIGRYGEVREGPDGRLYQWVQGVDGLGNPIGLWRGLRRLRRRLRSVVRRALPAVQSLAPFIPGVGPAAAVALTAAAPALRRAGVAGYGGLGALYQASDGTFYQMQGFAEDEELRGLGQDELTQVMGIGQPNEVRQGPDGKLYQWVQGVDGLGSPIGLWRGLRRLGRRLRSVARRAMPLVQTAASFVPGVGPAVAAGVRAATPFAQRAGILGHNGLGALYQSPDGTLYQVQGLAEDEDLRGFAEDDELRGLAEEDELRGLAEDDELRGLAEDEDIRGVGEDEELRGLAQEEELRGFGEDEELRGFAEDEELRGFAEDDELRGLAEDEELRGIDQGYVRQNGVSGFDAYVPDQPVGTRWFTPPAEPPEMWKPLW
jgi:hypothetical protein